MAAGCIGASLDEGCPRDSGAPTPRGLRRSLLVLIGITLGLGVGALQPVAAGPGPNTPFNGSVALPGAAGSSQPVVVIGNAGTAVVVGSTVQGDGCPLSVLSHDGSTSKYLGRPGTGAGCAVTVGPLQLGTSPVAATGNLALSSQSADGTATGRSQDGGASFTWSNTSGPSAMAALVADPAINATGLSTAFLVVRDATTGVPRIAVSTDGGVTYTLADPLINPADIDPALWQGAGPGPLVGNLVVRRDDSGLRLFTVIETADSAADRSAQAAAKTDNLNRVYTAIGTVSSTTPTATPTVAWHDVEAYQAPAGTGLNRGRPAISVDSAGHVYTVFSDGRHIYTKADFDGTKWNPAVAPLPVDTTAKGIPAGMDASLSPAVASGANGMVDVAWYGAMGGNASGPDPASDAHNTWTTYMAQTADGGATWTAYTVSDHYVHHGALSYPGAALAIAVDQVSGAAFVAYADDLTTPGLSSLFATRQCTGLSAVSGTSLVDDCVASQPATPVLPGSTCPGPQVADITGDAPDNSPTGAGQNLYSLDIVSAKFTSPDPATEQATISVNRLIQQLPAGISQAWWRLYWTLNGTQYYVQVSMVSGQMPSYTLGTVNADGSLAGGQTVPGLIAPGSGGSFLITLPHTMVANPAPGATVSAVHAASYAHFIAPGSSASAVTLIDRAPDGGSGADYAIGQLCAPQAALPDAPLAALLPIAGGMAGLFVTFERRRRSRRAASQNATSTATTNQGDSDE